MPIGAILGGALAGGGALFGALTGSNAAASAAKTQAQAAQNALNFQQNIYGQTATNLSPYYATGTNALGALRSGVGAFGGAGYDPNAPLLVNPQNAFGPPPTLGALPQYNPQGFQQSPGYQWQLGQGIDAVQKAATGPQGTLSGNMLSAAQTYGTGLANQDYYNWIQQIYNPTYQSQLTNVLTPYNAATNTYWQNVSQADQTQQNALRALAALAGAGQNAAVQQGGFGQSFGGQAGNLITGAGAAQAAGTVGSANALTGGVNSLLTYLLGAPQSGNTNLSNLGNSLSSLLGLDSTSQMNAANTSALSNALAPGISIQDALSSFAGGGSSGY